MPDPTAPAHYSFLPWFRRGIINLAEAGSLSEREPVAVTLSLQAVGEGEAPVPITRPVQLVGPGQISGLDPLAIVRTLPLAGVRDFEANYLCAIEFYDEDFPWRYTPLLPAAGQLAPWLWLVALTQEEYVRRAPTDGALPAIEISPEALASAFPDPAATWAWAHTHLNFEVAGATPADRRQLVATTLQENPNLGCSRLVCPRRLRPGTRYTAFLVPAFEKGRLAGLGHEAQAIGAIANAAPAWVAGGDGRQLFPVYQEWEFATQAAGDFESLARRLAPLSPAEAQALAAATASRQVDIRAPGWGLAYGGTPGTIPLESALKPLHQPQEPPITDRAGTADVAFLQDLTGLLNLGITPLGGDSAGQQPNPFFPGSSLEDDPILVPPLYGSFYRGSGSPFGPPPGPVALNPAPPIADWYNQLNLNPALRVAAGQGTAVVQQNQEQYMDRAWDQVSQNYEAHRLVKRWDYSLQVSQRLFEKRFLPLLGQASPEEGQEGTFRALAFMAPLFPKLRMGGTSFRATLRGKKLPAAYSRAFAKVIRPGGPLVRRLNPRQAEGAFFETEFVAGPPPNFLFSTVTNIIAYLELLARLLIFPPLTQRKDEQLIGQGLAGYEPVLGALIALQPYLQLVGISVFIRPDNGALYRSVASQVSPQATLTARLQGLLVTGAGETGPPVFPEPMYAPLAGRSTDLLLPGVDRVPGNRVALLRTNPAFIEAYMVGLNHEISREYLWREFPAPLNTTAFRQFWDNRDNPGAGASPDIGAISGWGTTALGSHPPEGKTAEKMVLLVRGELLEKYPHTEIFLQNAWEGTLVYPVFSGRIAPDIRFIGFDLDPDAVVPADGTNPGWRIVLKERAGEVHFGLDLEASATDPSWEALGLEVPEHRCLDVTGAAFRALPRFGGDRADHLAAMLYQKPFMLLVPAARLVPKP